MGETDETDEIDDIVEAIVASRGRDIGRLAEAYRSQGTEPPRITRWPDIGQLALPRHRDLFAWWRDNTAPDAPAPADLIKPDNLQTHLGRIVLLEPLDGGRDFVYRLYGSIVAEFAGFDLTGRRLSETETMGIWSYQVRLYYLATYRAAARSGAPIYSTLRLTNGMTPFDWQRLLLPFADSTGAITRLMLCTLPCGSDGRLLDSWEARKQ